MHITQINNFFKQTNMRKGYKKQILNHNIEKFGLIVRVDLDMFSFAKTLTQAKQNAILQVNLVNNAKKIMEDLKWHLRKNKYQKLQYSCLSINYWCLAETTADKASVLGLVNALAIFIKQEQANIKKGESTLYKRHKNNNSS